MSNTGYGFITPSEKLLEMEKEAQEVQAQLTPAEMKERLGKLIEESPSRQRGRFAPDYSLTEEYLRLTDVDSSTMGAKEAEEHASKLFNLKKFGTYTDEMRQAEIDNSLAIPLSEAIKLRDQYRADIERLEEELDSFDISAVQAEADLIAEEYKQRMRGATPHQRAVLKDAYDRAVSELEHKKITLPKNDLKVKRAEAVERYKVYEHRIQLYVATNREAINRQIERARDAEINENLLALAEYVEG